MSEEMIIRHCSPTLAGLKTGNMFSCSYDSVDELRREIRDLNRRLAAKGLCILPLRIEKKTALIYVYRPKKLKRDLCDEAACRLLKEHGYGCNTPGRCLVRLSSRLQERAEFPHEIGLFLGYPPEDVRGFIENNATSCKCVGCWKVYGDEQQARQTFAKYKKCTDVYIRQLTKGNTLDRLTVAM